jgi:hypothetical protein
MPTLYRFLLGCSGDAAEKVRDEVRLRIDRDLTINFDDAQEFWLAMKRFNVALTGSYVLSFLDPLSRERYDRIEVVAGRKDFWSFLQFLSDHKTYRSISFVSDLPNIRSSAYKLVVDVVGKNTTVRLIQCPVLHPLYTVAQFNSTHLMNAILFDRLVVAYPTLTLRGRGVPCSPLLQKTSFELGLMSTFMHSRTCGSALCGATSRSFSDEHVACIRLQDIDESPLLNEYCPGTVTWMLGGTPCNEYCTSSEKVVHLI